MFVCDFLRAILVLLIPLFLYFNSGLSAIYILIFLIFSIGRFFIPAKLSIVPELVKKERLLIANSLVNTTAMIAAIIGFGVGGLLVEWLGVRGGFCLNAAGFFISGLLIFFITKRTTEHLKIKELSKEIVEVISKSVIQEIREGIAYFIKQKNVRFTGAIMFFLGGALGAIYVTFIVFVQETLKSATKDLGLLAMFLGLGLFLGALVYGRFGGRLSHFRVIFSSLIVSGVMLTVFAVALNRYPSFLLAANLSFALGLAVSPIIISCNTLIHNSSQNEMMGRVFSSLEFLMHLSFILFMFLSSFLAERISPNLILITVGFIFILSGFIGLILRPKILCLD